MPVLPTSPSDHTAFVRANAQLPTNGKVVKSTNTAPAVSVAVKAVTIASKAAVAATPATVIVTTTSKVTTSNKVSIK